MKIKIEDIKKLREETGAGVMDGAKVLKKCWRRYKRGLTRVIERSK